MQDSERAQEAKCGLCGEPMPEGEEMFKFHGYSGGCPKPPLAEVAKYLGSMKPTVEPEPPKWRYVGDGVFTAAKVEPEPCVWRITSGPLGTWVNPTCVEGAIPAPWGTERAKACHLCGAPLKVEREP